MAVKLWRAMHGTTAFNRKSSTVNGRLDGAKLPHPAVITE
jgi:hypothetical protein